ncbi:MAG: kelch motif-containing protein, partial [Acidobacteriota bacterium]|nr:kelch motif-containing protein [Acidobacteriota bacterium]
MIREPGRYIYLAVRPAPRKSTQSWSELPPDGVKPPARFGHTLIFDPVRDRMIVSHGLTDASGRPLRRCLHHAAYDPKRDQMFLYGGCSSGFGPCPRDDLWTFDLQSNRWTQRVSTPRPPGRERYGMAFDSRRVRL